MVPHPPDTSPDPSPPDVQSLTTLFDTVRSQHLIDVMQSRLLGCTCGASLPIEVDDEGQPLYNPAIRHHHEKMAEAVIGLRLDQTRETFALGAAWAMGDDEEAPAALKARLAAAEAVVARVEEVLDCADARREGLIDVRLERDLRGALRPTPISDERVSEGDFESCRCGSGREPEYCSHDDCHHHWLDRPESDTRECLICGAER